MPRLAHYRRRPVSSWRRREALRTGSDFHPSSSCSGSVKSCEIDMEACSSGGVPDRAVVIASCLRRSRDVSDDPVPRVTGAANHARADNPAGSLGFEQTNSICPTATSQAQGVHSSHVSTQWTQLMYRPCCAWLQRVLIFIDSRSRNIFGTHHRVVGS